MKIVESVGGFEMGLNIEDTRVSKSASLVDPYVQKLNTIRGDGVWSGGVCRGKPLGTPSNLTIHRGCHRYNASRGPVEGAHSQGTVSPGSP